MYKAKPYVQTSVKLSPEFYDLCKTHFISFTEAMRIGISIVLAEKGVREYDNNLNIVRRINELKVRAAEYAQKAANLEAEKELKFAKSQEKSKND